jgi:endonuclease YncB( thermonuclease family)
LQPPALFPFLLCLTLAASAPVVEDQQAATRPSFTLPKASHVVAPAAWSRGAVLPGPFLAEITEVIDGDTVETRVTVWLGHEVTTRVRLRGIDAPEMSSECGQERRLAQAAKEALRAKLKGSAVSLINVGKDKYGGRVLASIILPTGEDASAAMLASGHARPYQGGKRQPWCGTDVIAQRR